MTRAWAQEGTRLLLAGLDRLDDASLDEPCALPDWPRRHLLAHVASNAEAIGRLLTWARTGVETPMYASPEQRAADIETGATVLTCVPGSPSPPATWHAPCPSCLACLVRVGRDGTGPDRARERDAVDAGA